MAFSVVMLKRVTWWSGANLYARARGLNDWVPIQVLGKEPCDRTHMKKICQMSYP
jgi:hypothetical protein